jgi:hypothetical protein
MRVESIQLRRFNSIRPRRTNNEDPKKNEGKVLDVLHQQNRTLNSSESWKSLKHSLHN